MGALRTLLILFAIFVAVWLLRRKLRGSAHHPPKGAGINQTREEMRACALCGTHAPVSTGILAGGAFYCCEDHWRAAKKS